MHDVDAPVLYTADLDGCSALATLAPEALRAVFVAALEGAGATVVDTVSHGFPGAGLTCVLILAESHAVVHTWPETGTVNVDVFSCSARLRGTDAISAIGQALGASGLQVRQTPRRR